MGSKEAIRKLRQAGFIHVRQGKGDHVLFEKGDCRVIVPNGKKELSYGSNRLILNALKNERIFYSKSLRSTQ